MWASSALQILLLGILLLLTSLENLSRVKPEKPPQPAVNTFLQEGDNSIHPSVEHGQPSNGWEEPQTKPNEGEELVEDNRKNEETKEKEEDEHEGTLIPLNSQEEDEAPIFQVPPLQPDPPARLVPRNLPPLVLHQGPNSPSISNQDPLDTPSPATPSLAVTNSFQFKGVPIPKRVRELQYEEAGLQPPVPAPPPEPSQGDLKRKTRKADIGEVENGIDSLVDTFVNGEEEVTEKKLKEKRTKEREPKPRRMRKPKVKKETQPDIERHQQETQEVIQVDPKEEAKKELEGNVHRDVPNEEPEGNIHHVPKEEPEGDVHDVPKEDIAKEENDIFEVKGISKEGVRLGNVTKDLRELMFGKRKSSRRFPLEWQQGFFFNEPDQEILQYGLVQLKGGPCGILAAVQGFIVKYLFFESNTPR